MFKPPSPQKGRQGVLMSDEPKPNAASEDPKSLQNGLGLDTLLAGNKPITKPSKPSSKTDKVVEKVVEAQVGKPESKPDANGSRILAITPRRWTKRTKTSSVLMRPF